MMSWKMIVVLAVSDKREVRELINDWLTVLLLHERDTNEKPNYSDMLFDYFYHYPKFITNEFLITEYNKAISHWSRISNAFITYVLDMLYDREEISR